MSACDRRPPHLVPAGEGRPLVGSDACAVMAPEIPLPNTLAVDLMLHPGADLPDVRVTDSDVSIVWTSFPTTLHVRIATTDRAEYLRQCARKLNAAAARVQARDERMPEAIR